MGMLFGAGCLLTAASPALANAVTGLIWIILFHLVVVNVLLGLGEATILKLAFGAKARAFVLLIVANFVSMLAGLHFLSSFFHDTFMSAEITLHNAMGYIVAAWVVTFAVTAVLEWPFCWLSLPKRPRRVAVALGASLVVNIASYAVLLPLYSYTHGWGVMGQVRPDQSVLATTPAGMCVYYLSPETGGLWRASLDGRDCRKVLVIGNRGPRDRLFARPAASGRGYDLWMGGYDEKSQEILIPSFAAQVGRPAPSHGWGHGAPATGPRQNEPDIPREFGPSAMMPDIGPGDWDVWTGHDRGTSGLVAINKRTNEQIFAAMATPFLYWQARNATLVSASQVVYQLGRQIVLLDLETRKIALIAMGEGPVVASSEPPAATMPTSSRPRPDPASAGVSDQLDHAER